MTIASETIDQVRLATNIVDLVREYVPHLKKAGRNWKANCPFHHEKTPSFMVSADKGIFHCFGCHAGGDAFKFVMLMDSLSWPEAVQKLAERSGIAIKETHDEIIKRSEKQKIYDILEQAAHFYHRHLLDSSEGVQARQYLKKRGVTGESIERFCLGFAPGGALVSAAAKKGFSVEQLMAAGLVTRTDRGTYYEYMSDRLVFPIIDSQGRVVAFGGRTLKDEQPKYLNSPETAVYSKSQQLYGLFAALPALRKEREAVVLEGYMDVVMTHQFGVTNTMATLGTALTSQQSHMVERYADKVILLFDSDNAGHAAARRAIENMIDTELALRVAHLPDGMDPDEYVLKRGREEFLEYLKSRSVSAVEFLADHAVRVFGIDSPENKAKAVRDVLPVINKVKNAILKGEWAKYLAYRLQVNEGAMESELRTLGKPGAARPGGEGETMTAPKGRRTLVRTVEEEILQIIVAYPHYRGKVSEETFKEERHRKMYRLLAQDIPIATMVNHMDEADVRWFTELTLEEKCYSSPEQTLVGLLQEMKLKELESQRQALEKEIIPMLNGKIPMDNAKVKLYQDLNRQLKGSVRLQNE